MLTLDIDNTTSNIFVPTQSDFEAWAALALHDYPNAELSIRIVDEAESAQLNGDYRGKPKPTNVLSFPADIPAVVQSPLLGDLVICAAVVAQEAIAQHKPLLAHWAHMTIHGCLHLLGYDHIKLRYAKIMEQLEVQILKKLGFEDPYL